MFKGLLVVVALAAPSAAYAGCTERTASDAPGPFATICAGAKCEKAQLDVVCSNVSGATYVYDNKVTLIMTTPGSPEGETSKAIRDGVVVASFKCTPIDDGACPAVNP